MESKILVVLCLAIIVPICIGQIVDPATVTCGKDEFTWCEYSNGLTRGEGAAPRKCAGKCICEGHPSFHGDNLDWIDGKCVTPKGHVCGKSTDGKMEIFCATGSNCIEGRCRDPNAPKLKLGEKCKEDVECETGLGCKVFYVKSGGGLRRPTRSIGPQYCCHRPDMGETEHTLEDLPCKKA